MSFDLRTGMLGGLVGTLVMDVLRATAKALGITTMPSMQLIQGATATDEPGRATLIGTLTHYSTGTVLFGSVYTLAFSVLRAAGWLRGFLRGLGHGVISGFAMKLMGTTHPRMESTLGADDEVWRHDEAGLRIARPGWFARNYGPLTPLGLVMVHGVYGAVVGAVMGRQARYPR